MGKESCNHMRGEQRFTGCNALRGTAHKADRRYIDVASQRLKLRWKSTQTQCRQSASKKSLVQAFPGEDCGRYSALRYTDPRFHWCDSVQSLRDPHRPSAIDGEPSSAPAVGTGRQHAFSRFANAARFRSLLPKTRYVRRPSL
jgi:hypothetical protein